MHLLLVEDDEALAFVTKRSLEKRGYTVHWFSNLPEAQAALATLPLDYALLDLKVGTDSSLEFIGQIKRTHPHVSIVLITGYSSIATARQLKMHRRTLQRKLQKRPSDR